MRVIREDIAKYIAERDGQPCDPNDVFLSTGASDSIKVNVWLLIELNISVSECTGLVVGIWTQGWEVGGLNPFDGNVCPRRINCSWTW